MLTDGIFVIVKGNIWLNQFFILERLIIIFLLHTVKVQSWLLFKLTGKETLSAVLRQKKTMEKSLKVGS